MNLERTTALYTSVLLQLLPEGVYDTAESTRVYDDVYAHAKALAQCDIHAHRLLDALNNIPVELLNDYEIEYGLPLQCAVPSDSIEQRLQVLKWVRQHRNVMNREYLEQLFAIFGVTLIDIQKYVPMQCIGTCVEPVNSERSRFKVFLSLEEPVTADMGCIIENYLPGYIALEFEEKGIDNYLVDPILSIQKTSNGLELQWTASGYITGLTYTLYRNNEILADELIDLNFTDTTNIDISPIYKVTANYKNIVKVSNEITIDLRSYIVKMNFENGFINTVDNTVWSQIGAVSRVQNELLSNYAILSNSTAGIYEYLNLGTNFEMSFDFLALNLPDSGYNTVILEYGNGSGASNAGDNGFLLTCYGTTLVLRQRYYFASITITRNTKYQIKIYAREGLLGMSVDDQDVTWGSYYISSGERIFKLGTGAIDWRQNSNFLIDNFNIEVTL